MNYNSNLTVGEKAGRYLKELRKKAGKTQEEYAEMLVTSSRNYQRWERCLNNISLIEQNCNILGIEFNDFLDHLKN